MIKKENEQLHKKNEELKEENAELYSKNVNLKNIIEFYNIGCEEINKIKTKLSDEDFKYYIMNTSPAEVNADYFYFENLHIWRNIYDYPGCIIPGVDWIFE